MAFSTQDSDEVLSEINVTPLVDVMLVLLVVFIVTAPLLTNAIPINLPKTEAVAPPDQKDPLVVSIDGEGKLFINKDEIQPDLLQGNLEAAKARTRSCACSCRRTTRSTTARWPRPWPPSSAPGSPSWR